MSDDSDSNVRCFKAIELTLRFVVTCFLPLAFLGFGICLVFERGYRPGVDAMLIIMVFYFAIAYRNVHRDNKTSLIIAGLAGLTTGKGAGRYNVSAVAGRCSADDEDDWIPSINPATGLMMVGALDSAGNSFGSSGTPDWTSDGGASGFDGNHHSFNPANGLPMMDDVIDIHCNMFGTNSMDDLFDHSSSTFDDSFTHSSFDDSFNSSFFDDDWNK